MKKIIALVLAVCTLALAACTKPAPEESKQESAAPVVIDIEKVAAELAASGQFSGTSAMAADRLELKYAIDLSDMVEGVFYLPTDAECANMFIIAKAKDGAEALLFDEIGMLVDKYDHSWTDVVYNAAEAKKVKDRSIVKVDGYYICVVSDDNQAVLDTILK